jgi:hypothetical protein
MMGRKAEDVVDVPCGNTCSLVGVDEAILKPKQRLFLNGFLLTLTRKRT